MNGENSHCYTAEKTCEEVEKKTGCSENSNELRSDSFKRRKRKKYNLLLVYKLKKISSVSK